MAIPTGTGTEGLRNAMFDGVSDQTISLITGVRYHIYTVLSIIVHNSRGATASNTPTIYMTGYDNRASASGSTMNMLHLPILGIRETYVWNDKFSFYGCENDVSQSTATSQYLRWTGGGAYDVFDIHVTYIDQDWT
jgi:hypothetical protein